MVYGGLTNLAPRGVSHLQHLRLLGRIGSMLEEGTLATCSQGRSARVPSGPPSSIGQRFLRNRMPTPGRQMPHCPNYQVTGPLQVSINFRYRCKSPWSSSSRSWASWRSRCKSHLCDKGNGSRALGLSPSGRRLTSSGSRSRLHHFPSAPQEKGTSGSCKQQWRQVSPTPTNKGY